MEISVRRLGPSDVGILAELALRDAEFDIEGRSKPLQPLTEAAALEDLSDPHVLHWVAEENGRVLGDMYCHLLRKRAGEPFEVLLYEIGVHEDARRRGIGRMLIDAMDARGIREAWVCADNPGAVRFYEACGFEAARAQPTYMTHERIPR